MFVDPWTTLGCCNICAGLLELSMIISEGLQPQATSRVFWKNEPEGEQITMDPTRNCYSNAGFMPVFSLRSLDWFQMLQGMSWVSLCFSMAKHGGHFCSDLASSQVHPRSIAPTSPPGKGCHTMGPQGRKRPFQKAKKTKGTGESFSIYFSIVVRMAHFFLARNH